MRKTKIVCTLGPSTDQNGVLREMILAGMNVARFNFSHGTHEEHKARLDTLKALREELDALIAAVRQREAQVRTRSIQRYETALRVLRANPSAKAKAELGEAFDSLRKLLEK